MNLYFLMSFLKVRLKLFLIELISDFKSTFSVFRKKYHICTSCKKHLKSKKCFQLF